jgi:hypothetical protein
MITTAIWTLDLQTVQKFIAEYPENRVSLGWQQNIEDGKIEETDFYDTFDKLYLDQEILDGNEIYQVEQAFPGLV